MVLGTDEVARIAHLARLALSADEAVGYARDLSAILDFVAQLEAADTEGVEPMAHPQDVAQRLRPDAVTEADRRAAYQAVAPLTENGLYLVPKVIE